VIRLFLLDAVGNLALFALAYYWLGLRTSSTGNVIISVALVVLMTALVAYLIALAFNRDARASVGRIPPLLIWLGIAGLVAGLFFYLSSFAPAIENWLNSALTLATRTPIQLKWIPLSLLLIALGIISLRHLIPVAVRTANQGVDGLRDWRAVPLSLGYLAAALAWILIGLWIPWQLFWWIPKLVSFEAQMASFLIRVSVAFAIYVGAWLLFASYCRTKTLPPER